MQIIVKFENITINATNIKKMKIFEKIRKINAKNKRNENFKNSIIDLKRETFDILYNKIMIFSKIDFVKAKKNLIRIDFSNVY